MTLSEKNIKSAFQAAKADIINLQREILELNIRQQKIMQMLSNLDRKLVVTHNNVVKNRPKVKPTYVASKAGEKFHTTNCPYAKNIKGKTKIFFANKQDAIAQGFKPCNCVE